MVDLDYINGKQLYVVYRGVDCEQFDRVKLSDLLEDFKLHEAVYGCILFILNQDGLRKYM